MKRDVRKGRRTMDRVVVTIPWFTGLHGLCYMQVCVAEDATDEEILTVCNRDYPTGTSKVWMKVFRQSDPDGSKRPTACEEYPGRKHFLVRY